MVRVRDHVISCVITTETIVTANVAVACVCYRQCCSSMCQLFLIHTLLHLNPRPSYTAAAMVENITAEALSGIAGM